MELQPVLIKRRIDTCEKQKSCQRLCLYTWQAKHEESLFLCWLVMVEAGKGSLVPRAGNLLALSWKGIFSQFLWLDLMSLTDHLFYSECVRFAVLPPTTRMLSKKMPLKKVSTLNLFCRNVPYRMRVRLSRKRNEDEDSPNKLYTLVTYVPVTTCKGRYAAKWLEASA